MRHPEHDLTDRQAEGDFVVTVKAFFNGPRVQGDELRDHALALLDSRLAGVGATVSVPMRDGRSCFVTRYAVDPGPARNQVSIHMGIQLNHAAAPGRPRVEDVCWILGDLLTRPLESGTSWLIEVEVAPPPESSPGPSGKMDPRFDDLYHLPIPDQVAIVENLIRQWWGFAHAPLPDDPITRPGLAGIQRLADEAIKQATWPMTDEQFDAVSGVIRALGGAEDQMRRYATGRRSPQLIDDLAGGLRVLLSLMALKHTGVEYLLRTIDPPEPTP